MSRSDFDDPPPNWSQWPVTQLTNQLYYGWPPGEAKPWVYHWCTTRQVWSGSHTGNHDLVTRDPLHLEPSLYWPNCCGLHGFGEAWPLVPLLTCGLIESRACQGLVMLRTAIR